MGCNKKWDGKALQKTPAMQYSFLPNTYDPDPNAPVTFLLMPSKMQQAANTAARNLKKAAGDRPVGQQPFAEAVFRLQQAEDRRTETERPLGRRSPPSGRKKGALMTSAANAYAFPASTAITDNPRRFQPFLYRG